jgi:hypothetical protein
MSIHKLLRLNSVKFGDLLLFFVEIEFGIKSAVCFRDLCVRKYAFW